MADEGIVYILSNEAMPGLVKVGITQRNDLDDRLNELYKTNVPFPFVCEYACRVKDCRAVENAIHTILTKERVNPSREFFKTSVEYIKPVLDLLKIEDITGSVNEEINNDIPQGDIQAANNYRKRRPPMNFTEMGIPIGSELTMNYEDTEYKVTIASSRTVIFNGKETHLSPVTREIKKSEYDIQPGPYWYYNGKLLSDIYDETYTFCD